jgi:hypothetical protein
MHWLAGWFFGLGDRMQAAVEDTAVAPSADKAAVFGHAAVVMAAEQVDMLGGAARVLSAKQADQPKDVADKVSTAKTTEQDQDTRDIQVNKKNSYRETSIKVGKRMGTKQLYSTVTILGR